MRTIVTRSSVIAAVAFVALAASAAAQTPPVAILNTLEVQKLAKSAEPQDNARLAAHFNALADRYTGDAKRHTAMAQSFGGNPSRNLGLGMSAHCKRIADLNTQSATTLRELATHHRKVAAGIPSIAPSASAAFRGGAGAHEPTGKDLAALAAKASSAADHRALEEYFLTAAKRYTAAATDHAAFAQAYRGTRLTWASGMHDRLAGVARDSAAEATAAAAMHRDMASVAR
jgi:hypothetical protein